MSFFRKLLPLVFLLTFSFLLSFFKVGEVDGSIKNPYSLWLNISGSYPRGFYRQVEKPAQKGDFVVFCLPFQSTVFGLEREYLEQGLCPNGSKPLIKQIYAKEGDLVKISAEAVQINSKYYLSLAPLKLDAKARELKPYIGNFVTGKNQFWLFSDYIKNSWDSRYFGPIDKEQIIAVVEPFHLFEK